MNDFTVWTVWWSESLHSIWIKWITWLFKLSNQCWSMLFCCQIIINFTQYVCQFCDWFQLDVCKKLFFYVLVQGEKKVFVQGSLLTEEKVKYPDCILKSKILDIYRVDIRIKRQLQKNVWYVSHCYTWYLLFYMVFTQLVKTTLPF